MARCGYTSIRRFEPWHPARLRLSTKATFAWAGPPFHAPCEPPWPTLVGHGIIDQPLLFLANFQMKLLPAQQFQATGPDGVVWSFDPFSGKWTVNQNGKQSSSQKFETLTQKLEQWKKAEKLVETPHEVREMELLRLRSNHSFSNSSLEVTNVRVRLEWNPKEEAYQVSKYLLRQEGAGSVSYTHL